MRQLRLLVASLLVVAGMGGCSRTSSGSGADEPTAVVARSPVPLTISGDQFVTRQASYSASVAAVDGAFAVLPSGASTAPTFKTSSIERGANSVEFGAAGIVSDGLGGVGVGRGPVLEQIQAVAQGLELSWTFPVAPEGRGDALVRVGVTGAEVVKATADSTVLRDAASGAQLRVGRALWIDAAGKMTALSQSFADGVLTFRIPEALLLSSTYPAVLDPLVTPASYGPVAFADGVASGDINSLTVGVSGPGSVTSDDASGGINCGTTGTACTASYTKDSLVTLTPHATDAGGFFIGWSGLCTGTDPCTIAMSKARFVYAYFEPGSWPVKVFKVGKGKGTISWNGNTCPATDSTCTFLVPNTRPVRQTVSLSAVPDANSSFTGWSADCGPDACSLYVDRRKNAYATFASNVLTVRVQVDEIGTVLVSPNGITCTPTAPCTFTVPRVPTQQITLTASPANTFYAWGGDCRGSDTTCTLTVDDDKNVYASWRGIHSAWGSSSGEVTVFAAANSDHAAVPWTTRLTCASCHPMNLMAQHGRQCQICHATGGPAEQLVGRWNGTCSAGACHASVHAASGSDHFGVYWNSSASCDLCHTQGGTFPGPADRCGNCHSASITEAAFGDTTPPVTTSDAQPVYVGGGAIHLTATDAGSGVALTSYYHLTHNRWEIGTDPYIGQVPTSGPGIQYTLRFYSIDRAGNKEAEKSVTYLVKPVPVADTTPPVTTPNIFPPAGYAYDANQPITLAATDAGSGVQATSYRIDAGSWQTGTSFTVTEGLHTFSYYSVDNAGNQETIHVSNPFRVDTIAPATTCSAQAGGTYLGAQTFTLSPTDVNGSGVSPGTGVSGTWWRLDGSGAAPYTAGTSIPVPAPASGSASHTINWYSIDVAGNWEAMKAVTFTVQAAGPVDTTPPTTTSSFNPTANAIFSSNQAVTLTPADNVGGSGVKATYYWIDTGSHVTGTSFTITQGLHTFSYYSVDNANNTELTKTSSSFCVDSSKPVTTSTAGNGATYTGAQTFSLSATDVGCAGVASTWYKLDGGAFTSGTSIQVTAPASGSASHTLSWYSIDRAGNQEATQSVTFTVQAAAVSGQPITLSFRTNASFGGWSYVLWEVHDTAGNVVNDVNGNACTWWNDDPGHPSSMWMDYVVPSGVDYVMYGAWGPMPDGPDVETATNPVSSTQPPGTTVTWWQW